MATRLRITPEDPFPADLSRLSNASLHILNSQLHRQFEYECIHNGYPSRDTEFRQNEVTEEMDLREAQEVMIGFTSVPDKNG